jgi:class 3 adenylate cyclase
MDLSPVRYARAPDGAQIAWAEIGSGPPLLYLSHRRWGLIELVQRTREYGAFVEALGGVRRVICIDSRGVGYSAQRLPRSRGELVTDLFAVADSAGAGSFDLMTYVSFSAVFALEAALSQPSRVSRLILSAPVLRFSDLAAAGPYEAFHAISAKDRGQFARSLAGFSSLEPDDFEVFDQVVGGASQELVEAVYAIEREVEPPSDLAELRTPALVVEFTEGAVPSEPQRRAAAEIPGASLVTVAAGGSKPTAALSAIRDFLLEDEPPEADVPPAPGLQTILFTDLEASTQLTQRLGDEQAQQLLRGHDATVRAALEAHAGREVKHTGDGIMAAFSSAVAAVAAALQIQRELAGAELRVRIGLNAGEPIATPRAASPGAQHDDLFGLAVIKASRIADRADPGQVLASDVVRQLCEGKRLAFTPLGDVLLKGFDDPVPLFAVTDPEP